jgi:gamma-glutamyl hydrolase
MTEPHTPHLRTLSKATVALSKLSSIVLPPQPPPSLTTIATIAIFSMPMIEVNFDGFQLPDSYCAAAGGVNSFYVRWLEAAGIRVFILQWDDPWEEKLKTLQQVNGVLLPGGDLDHFQAALEAYFARVKEVYAYAVTQSTEHNDPFFLWGTCQGFQMLCAAAADDLRVVQPGFVDTACVMLPLSVDATEIADSRFLSPATAPPHILRALQDAPSTLNVHRYGVAPETFQTNAKLRAAFRVLSTNVDGAGRHFVSTIEHRSAAIVAVQWHPEWPPFDFSDARIAQTDASMAVSSYVALFIRSQLRRNGHAFHSVREMERSIIERCPVTYEGFGWELYWNKAVKSPIVGAAVAPPKPPPAPAL